MDIQYYPGHMARAERLLRQKLPLVDVVAEVADARLPRSSRRPDLKVLLGAKPHILVLNKADLADAAGLDRWLKDYQSQGTPVVAVDSRNGQGAKQLIQMVIQLAQPALQKLIAKGQRQRMPRLVVVGMPNVGKSSLINRLAGQRSARAGAVPGVTRGQQWIRVQGRLELLDTPGILVPKIADPKTGIKLVAAGVIASAAFDPVEVASILWPLLVKHTPQALAARYQVSMQLLEPGAALQAIGRQRGFLLTGGEIDIKRAAQALLQDVQQGNLGRLMLD